MPGPDVRQTEPEGGVDLGAKAEESALGTRTYVQL
jgi:hypothetical protein